MKIPWFVLIHERLEKIFSSAYIVVPTVGDSGISFWSWIIRKRALARTSIPIKSLQQGKALKYSTKQSQ